MDELELLRQKKMQEMQQQASQQEKLQEELSKLESLIKTKMTKEAISRYGNIKLSHPHTAMNLLALLTQILERDSDKTITDEDLKRMLMLLNQNKRETKITRK